MLIRWQHWSGRSKLDMCVWYDDTIPMLDWGEGDSASNVGNPLVLPGSPDGSSVMPSHLLFPITGPASDCPTGPLQGLARPRPPEFKSQYRDRYQDYKSWSLSFETETDTLNLLVSMTRPWPRPGILVSRSRLRTNRDWIQIICAAI